MSLIDLAERKARTRAFAFYGFATASVALLLITLGAHPSPVLLGMWLGLTFTAALCLTPFATRLKTKGPLARLLEDETTREHRQASSVVGLWAALLAAFAMIIVAVVPGLVSASDTARTIVTVAVAAALLHFATLELRAAR